MRATAPDITPPGPNKRSAILTGNLCRFCPSIDTEAVAQASCVRTAAVLGNARSPPDEYSALSLVDIGSNPPQIVREIPHDSRPSQGGKRRKAARNGCCPNRQATCKSTIRAAKRPWGRRRAARGPMRIERAMTQRLHGIKPNNASAELPDRTRQLRRSRTRGNGRVGIGDDVLSALERSTEAVLLVDAEQRIRYWNQGAARLLGRPAEAMLGKTVASFPSLRALLGESANLPEATSGQCREFITADGNARRLFVGSSVNAQPDGKSCRLWLIQDVTEAAQREEKERRDQHLAVLGQLSAGLSHEIKNPLAGIQAAAEILADRATDDDSRTVMRQILRETARIDRIVSQLRDWSRMSRVAEDRVSPVEVADRLVELLRGSSGRYADILVITDDVSRQARVLADEKAVEEILLNLLLNALEATRGRGVIRLAFACRNRSLILRVEDDGEGIPPDIAERVFDPFFTSKPGATGLGLAQCRFIANQFGGTLDFDKSYQNGAAFVLKLPNVTA